MLSGKKAVWTVFLVLLAVCSTGDSQGQTGWSTELTISNNAQDSLALVMGLHPEATDGIDSELQEVEQPPLPPSGIFDVRFQISGLNGLRNDFRAESEYAVIWMVQIQAGSGGYPVTLFWNSSALPTDRTFNIQDAVTGGTLINADMKTQGSVQIYNNLVTLIKITSTLIVDTSVRGVRVRIASPDSGQYAAIGQSIQLQVLRTKALAPAIDTVIVSLQAEPSLDMSPHPIIPAFLDTFIWPTNIGTSVDTYKFNFPMLVGYPETSPTAIMAQAFLYAPSEAPAAWRKLNNLSTQPMSVVTGFTDPVGDQKRIGIDVLRPLTSDILSVQIDTAFATRRLPGTPYRAYGIGDQVHIKLDVNSLEGASFAIVHLIDAVTPGYQHPDSSVYSRVFDLTTATSTTLRDTFVIEPGMFQTPYVRDNMRVKARAFLMDQAGNLSGATVSDSLPSSVDQNFQVVIDSRFPQIYLNFVESTRIITGRINDRFPFVDDNGVLIPDRSFSLRALGFRIDEGTISRSVVVGNDSANFGGTSRIYPAAVAIQDSFLESIGPINPAGNIVDMRISVEDSVGNRSHAYLENITLDLAPPIISRAFPSSEALPEDRINNVTRHPSFEVNEPADTVIVRYVQVGAYPPDVSTLKIGPQALPQTPGEIHVTVSDSLIDDERYTLQIWVRDKAGNLTITPPDTLTFDKDFQNPVADSFLVQLNTLPMEDSVLVGTPIPIKVTAIDSMLTRMAGDIRKAITYNKRGVLVRISAEGIQDLSGVQFSGDGVTDHGDGTANLSGPEWWLGEQTLQVQSIQPLRNFSVVVEDTSTIIIDGERAKVVNFNGVLSGLTIFAPISETTPAVGVAGVRQVGSGDEVPIYAIGCIGDGQATFNSIDLNVLDLQPATGLSQSDFAELRLYHSADAELGEDDTLLGTVAQADIQIGSTTTVSAETPHLTPSNTETFYLVSAVVAPGAAIGRGFRVLVLPGNVGTSVGRIGSAVFPGPADYVTVLGLSLTGFVHYYDDPNLPLADVQATRFPPGAVDTTNANGQYAFANVPSGSYQISFSKPFDFMNSAARQAIRGSDALLILQKTAFLLPSDPSADQTFAGDINADGSLNNSDAVGILRYLAFLDTHIGQTGQWRFKPGQITVEADGSVPDAQAFLMGDILPNFGRAADPVLTKQAIPSDGILEAADVSWQGDRVRIPIQVHWEGPVQTLLLSMAYNSDDLVFESVDLTDAGAGYLMAGNGEQAGRVSIALAGIQEQSIGAPIFQLALKVREGAPIGLDESTRLELLISRLAVNDLTIPIEAGAALSVQKTPDQFELLQNYPNPFNPDTQIRFALPEASQVRLVVYSALGQEMRVLVDRQMSAGFHAIRWDGKDTMGRPVSSGVYIYTMQAKSGFSTARRMVLLK